MPIELHCGSANIVAVAVDWRQRAGEQLSSLRWTGDLFQLLQSSVATPSNLTGLSKPLGEC
jgi:hypothetical protein